MLEALDVSTGGAEGDRTPDPQTASRLRGVVRLRRGTSDSVLCSATCGRLKSPASSRSVRLFPDVGGQENGVQYAVSDSQGSSDTVGSGPRVGGRGGEEHRWRGTASPFAELTDPG